MNITDQKIAEREHKLAEVRERMRQMEQEEMEKWDKEQAEKKEQNILRITGFFEEEGMLSIDSCMLAGFLLSFRNATEKQKETWTLKGKELLLSQEIAEIKEKTEQESVEGGDDQVDSKLKSSGEIFSDMDYCPECAKDEVESKLVRRKNFETKKEAAYCSKCKKMFNIVKVSRV